MELKKPTVNTNFLTTWETQSTLANNCLVLIIENSFFVLNERISRLGFFVQRHVWLQKYKQYLSYLEVNSLPKLSNNLIITDVHNLNCAPFGLLYCKHSYQHYKFHNFTNPHQNARNHRGINVHTTRAHTCLNSFNLFRFYSGLT